MSTAVDIPQVHILLLGDTEVGKSTFLSYDSGLRVIPHLLMAHHRRLTLGHRLNEDGLPPYELPKLRDLDQPFTFDITLYRRAYRFHFSDTASPTNYTLLNPSFIILCYDITRRDTLTSLKGKWKTLVEAHYNYDEQMPVMVLGLKRDLRREWTETDKGSVMPQEGVRVASEMRCDRYAECSAVTGELCREVLEDVARTAARTTTEKGAKSEGTECAVM